MGWTGVAGVLGIMAVGSWVSMPVARADEPKEASADESTKEETSKEAAPKEAAAKDGATKEGAAKEVPKEEVPKEEVRGPAQDLVLEVSLGYSGGVFTAIEGHDPTVTNGPMFHLGVGWAWTIKHNQSVGIAAIADGSLDTDRSTKMGGHVAGRYGGAAFLYGERAHLRLLFGYANAALDGNTYSGIGVGFGAGWHVPLGQRGNWKRVAFIAEIAPSWDFLGAGSQTLHRWNFGLLFGIAVI